MVCESLLMLKDAVCLRNKASSQQPFTGSAEQLAPDCSPLLPGDGWKA